MKSLHPSVVRAHTSQLRPMMGLLSQHNSMSFQPYSANLSLRLYSTGALLLPRPSSDAARVCPREVRQRGVGLSLRPRAGRPLLRAAAQLVRAHPKPGRPHNLKEASAERLGCMDETRRVLPIPAPPCSLDISWSAHGNQWQGLRDPTRRSGRF